MPNSFNDNDNELYTEIKMRLVAARGTLGTMTVRCTTLLS